MTGRFTFSTLVLGLWDEVVATLIMALKASRKPIKLLILARVPAHPCPSPFNRDPTDQADQTWH